MEVLIIFFQTALISFFIAGVIWTVDTLLSLKNK